MPKCFEKAAISLWLMAVLSQAACGDGGTGPDGIGALVSRELGLDIAYPTLTAGPGGRIYTVRPNDLDTDRLDARNADGDLIWTVPFAKCDGCFPVVDGAGNIYMAAGQGVMSWNATGTPRWTAPGVQLRSLAVSSTSKIYGAQVGFGTNQQVYALDAATGDLIWNKTIPEGGVGSVLLDEPRGTLYALHHGKAVALDMQTGATKFTATPLLGALCFGGSGAVGSDGTLYVACDHDMSSRLSAFSRTGEAKWIKNLAPENGTAVLVDASGVVYGANSVSVTALTPNGDVIWKLEGIFRSTVYPVIDSQKNVYIIAQERSDADPEYLVVNSGKIVGSKGPARPGSLGAFLLTAEGRVYYNSEGSLVYFDIPGSDPLAQWAQMGRDESRTSHR